MNTKNPFAVPQSATYTPQPPLPPGPPPPQPAQPDYSAYWAAAAAAQQAATPGYNPQWPVQQPGQAAAPPPRPPPEQSALYANYGYGGQQQWQQQQQQRPPQHFQPAPPVAQPPPPPPQPAYNPYQPQAGVYQQPYVPQAAPPQPIAPQVPYTPQAPAIQPFQQHAQPFFPQQQQQNRNNNRHNHNSSQHLPPAKRQRFDGPNRAQQPPPPQFQPPPPPPGQQVPTGPILGGVGVGINVSQTQSFGGGRGGGPGANQVPLGGGRGGFGGRGGNNASSRGGRGMGAGRGGMGGRGGAYKNMAWRGSGGGQGGNYRPHGSGRGFGTRDGRRGGSFNVSGSQNPLQQQQQQHGPPQQPQQQNFSGSFRGRHQNFGRGGRHDTSGLPHGPKGDASSSSGISASKKDENRRTLTDFKIVGLRIAALGWKWGVVSDDEATAEAKQEPEEAVMPPSEQNDTEHKPEGNTSAAPEVSAGEVVTAAPAVKTEVADEASVKQEGGPTTQLPPPPSRIRIYFHTPVTADDAHPISAQGSFSLGASHDTVVRKGKRKKLDDDDGDGDLEEGRGLPPPLHFNFGPNASSVTVDTDREGGASTASRASAAPSVAPSATETASEGDWLMAAIGEEEGSGDGNPEAQTADGDNLHDIDAEGEPDDYDDGNDYEDMDAHMGGVEDDQYHLGEHANAPSYEGDDVLPGHHGLKDSVDTESRADGDHEPPLPAPVLEHKADSAATPTVTTALEADTVPHSTASDIAAEHAVSSTEAVVDTDKSSSIQGQTAEVSSDAMETSEPPANTVEHQIATQSPGPDAALTSHVNGHMDVTIEETQPVDSGEDHPSSLTTPTATLILPSAQDNIAPSESNGADAQSSTAESGRVPSANRLSISYAAATRRLVIDAGVVDKLKVFRHEARIEVHLNIEKDKTGQYKGILIEGASDSSSTYHPLELSDQVDETVPPFSTINPPLNVVLTAYLDKARPLSEPRWVKTGDVQDWLKSMFGRMFWAAGDAADGWERKIEVMDADPPPTIWTVLEAWAIHSNVGQQIERQRFLRTHMTETDNILEVLLRLVRGERASYSQSTPVISAPSVSGPLLSALSHGSAHGAQQTHVSLAVLAIFRLAVEFAKKADEDQGKTEVEARVGEIIRCLPSHLIYKSLDGIFKEWRLEKKGSR